MHRCTRLNFLYLNDRLALVGSAIQAGVMRELEFMTLRTDGHARGCHPQFLSAPLIASGS